MHIQPDGVQASPLNIYKQQSERIRQDPAQERARQGAAAPVSQGDSVNVSSEARMMAEASRTAQETPDVRQERVAQLKAQVENGTYQTDNKSIAAAMLREDMGLFR